MWLVTTMIAGLVATVAWFLVSNKYNLRFLSAMLWGASLMILVDHVLGYEGGAFVEMETDGLITNGVLLGIAMLVPILMIWGISVIIAKKGNSVTSR